MPTLTRLGVGIDPTDSKRGALEVTQALGAISSSAHATTKTVAEVSKTIGAAVKDTASTQQAASTTWTASLTQLQQQYAALGKQLTGMPKGDNGTQSLLLLYKNLGTEIASAKQMMQELNQESAKVQSRGISKQQEDLARWQRENPRVIRDTTSIDFLKKEEAAALANFAAWKQRREEMQRASSTGVIRQLYQPPPPLPPPPPARPIAYPTVMPPTAPITGYTASGQPITSGARPFVVPGSNWPPAPPPPPPAPPLPPINLGAVRSGAQEELERLKQLHGLNGQAAKSTRELAQEMLGLNKVPTSGMGQTAIALRSNITLLNSLGMIMGPTNASLIRLTSGFSTVALAAEKFGDKTGRNRERMDILTAALDKQQVAANRVAIAQQFQTKITDEIDKATAAGTLTAQGAAVANEVQKVGLEELADAERASALAAREVEAATKGAASGFAAMLGAILPILAILAALALAIGALVVVWKLFSRAISAGREWEVMEARMKAVTGSSASARAELKRLSEFKLGTSFDMPELVDASLRLRALGVTGAASIEVLRELGNVADASGMKIGELTKIYDDIQRQNTVSLEQIVDLQQRGVDLIPELTKSSGRSGLDFVMSLQSGLITAREFEAALKSATAEGGKLFSATSDKAATLDGVLRKISDRTNEWFTSLGRPIAPALAEAFKAFDDWFSGLASGGGPEALGERVATIIREGIGAAKDGTFFDWLKKGFTDSVTVLRDMMSESATWAGLKQVMSDGADLFIQKIKDAITPEWYKSLFSGGADLVDPKTGAPVPYDTSGTAENQVAADSLASKIGEFFRSAIAPIKDWLEEQGDKNRAAYMDALKLAPWNGPNAASNIEIFRQPAVGNMDRRRGSIESFGGALPGELGPVDLPPLGDPEKDITPVGAGIIEQAPKFTEAATEIISGYTKLILAMQAFKQQADAQQVKGTQTVIEELVKANHDGIISTDELTRRVDELKARLIASVADPANVGEWAKKFGLSLDSAKDQHRITMAIIEQQQRTMEENLKTGDVSYFDSFIFGLQRAARAYGTFQSQLANLGSQIADTLGNGISTALGDIITGTKSAGQAFKDMAVSILNDIARMIIKMLVLKAVQAAVGMIGGGGGAIASTAGGVSGFALGGSINGPSHASGGVKIEAEGGEYIIRKDRVRNENMEMLNAYNQGRAMLVPKFPDGGYVGGNFRGDRGLNNLIRGGAGQSGGYQHYGELPTSGGYYGSLNYTGSAGANYIPGQRLGGDGLPISGEPYYGVQQYSPGIVEIGRGGDMMPWNNDPRLGFRTSDSDVSSRDFEQGIGFRTSDSDVGARDFEADSPSVRSGGRGGRNMPTLPYAATHGVLNISRPMLPINAANWAAYNRVTQHAGQGYGRGTNAWERSGTGSFSARDQLRAQSAESGAEMARQGWGGDPNNLRNVDDEGHRSFAVNPTGGGAYYGRIEDGILQRHWSSGSGQHVVSPGSGYGSGSIATMLSGRTNYISTSNPALDMTSVVSSAPHFTTPFSSPSFSAPSYGASGAHGYSSHALTMALGGPVEDLPRYHNGLMPGERGAVIKDDEAVVPSGMLRALTMGDNAGRGSQTNSFHVELHMHSDGSVASERQSNNSEAGARDSGEQLVGRFKQLLVDETRSGGIIEQWGQTQKRG